jgi:hypothetical protein
MDSAIQVIKEAGLFLITNWILWTPGDTIDIFDLTLHALKELQPDEFLPMFCTQFPGMMPHFDGHPKRTNRLEDLHLQTPHFVVDPAVTTRELLEMRASLWSYHKSSEFAALMKFRRQQFGEEKFKNLTAVRRERFLKYGIDIWNL